MYATPNCFILYNYSDQYQFIFSQKLPHVAGIEYVIEYVNYEVMLIDEKY